MLQMLYIQAVGGIGRSSIQHGPCAAINHEGQEPDYAYFFRSHHWPYLALLWIQKCQVKYWPQIMFYLRSKWKAFTLFL